MFGRWKRKEKHRADKQQGDPRGGLQTEEYRTAAPTDIVESDGTAMSGPGGAPPRE